MLPLLPVQTHIDFANEFNRTHRTPAVETVPDTSLAKRLVSRLIGIFSPRRQQAPAPGTSLRGVTAPGTPHAR